MDWWIVLVLYLLVINLVTYLLYGLDKWKAKKNKRRIPEKVLLSFAAVGGSVGALLGMYGFRHKTKHMKFKVGVPLILLAHVALAVWLIFTLA